jgi:Asp-tRNA(Asn)/Glu-tRNA(Gln) amidotransferase C subunit
MVNDRVFQDPLLFGNICHALNDIEPSFEWLSPVEPEEVAWASYEMLLNTHETPSAFSDEVKAYVRTVLLEDGYFKCPKELGWCELPSHIDMSKFEITEAAKKIQQVKLERITEYLRLRKKVMLDKLKELFPGTSFETSSPRVLTASSRKARRA